MKNQLDLIDNNEITKESNGNVVPVVLTPQQMLMHAISKGADLSLIEKLMDMHDRWESTKSRQAFNEAITAAKAEIPTIRKNRKVDFSGKTGMRTSYEFEDLAGIAETVAPILAKHGLSYRFRTDNKDGSVSVTCIIAHKSGYSEENTLCAGIDSTGNKNSIQAIASTVTYLQRYTLKAALGLAAGHDDDGESAEGNSFISGLKRDELQQLMSEYDIDIAAFCQYFRIKSLSEIKDSDYPRALAAINKSIAQKRTAHNG